jgi:hypothetical protein
VLYVSSTKPVRHPIGQVFSDGISAILKTVEATPRIKRPDLAAKILGEHHEAPEAAPRKEQLAADLHYLIHSGHVIEFSNGMLELPLAPQAKAPAQGPGKPGEAKPAPSESAAEGVDESTVTEAGETELETAAETETQPSAEAEATASSEPAQPAPVVEEVATTTTPESISTAQAPSSTAEPEPVAVGETAVATEPVATTEAAHETDPSTTA